MGMSLYARLCVTLCKPLNLQTLKWCDNHAGDDFRTPEFMVSDNDDSIFGAVKAQLAATIVVNCYAHLIRAVDNMKPKYLSQKTRWKKGGLEHAGGFLGPNPSLHTASSL